MLNQDSLWTNSRSSIHVILSTTFADVSQANCRMVREMARCELKACGSAERRGGGRPGGGEAFEHGPMQPHGSPRTDRDRLVLDFMPLARRVAHRYGGPLQREDLEQVAFLALVKAAERYDRSHGTSFPAYAIPTIVGEIKHFLRDHSWDLHVPRQVQERALLVTRASDELAGTLGRAPTIRELAEHLQLSSSDVLEALEAAAARDARSLDAPIERGDGDGADTPTAGLMGDEDAALELALERADLRRALARLSPEQREVIVLRFFADLTQSQIARRVGVSQMQVSRILRRALATMREFAGLQDPMAANPELSSQRAPRRADRRSLPPPCPRTRSMATIRRPGG